MDNNEDVRFLKKNKFSMNTYSFQQTKRSFYEKKTFINSMWTAPSYSRSLIQNFNDSNSAKQQLLYKHTILLPTFSMVINGSKRQGKTATAYKLGYESSLLGIKVFIFGVPEVPPWAETVYDISRLPDDCLLIIDEGAIFNSNRSKSGSGTVGILGILPILAHRGIKLIVITQSSMLLDVNFYKTVDCLLSKKIKKLNANFERDNIWNELDIRFIQSIERKSELYFKDDDIVLTCDLELCPDYEKYSKSFRKFRFPEEQPKAEAMLRSLIKFTDYEDKDISNIMSIWGFIEPVSYYKELRKEL